ncbi:M15 family metallopeptidase [Nocardioides sp. LHD-245]|uniref:M15 family metallopeptidase n=1 Tax=Nocardioides sp. LHD-245 TaxID=3051387 RepID=UPI0027E0F463|nr:M15 family metallopeptidase [Nocardioides sp. LHD-245]
MARALCGGVASFGTDEYRWMTVNAPATGWVNPSWARAGGSRPEPWHWEYVGS